MLDARTGDPEDQQALEPLTPRKRGLFRRGEDGLTTLEWLLIVAAVAGLAALAVVLVQNVVDQTAEQISGSSARQTAAKVAAASITQDARDEGTAANLGTQDDWNSLNSDYRDECNRLEITYGDAGVDASWNNTGTWMTDGATSAPLWEAGLDADTEGCVV